MKPQKSKLLLTCIYACLPRNPFIRLTIFIKPKANDKNPQNETWPVTNSKTINGKQQSFKPRASKQTCP